MTTSDPAMIVNKINCTSLSRLKSVNIIQSRLFGSCNVLLKDSKDSNDGGSGSDHPKKDHLFKLLQELTEQSRKIEELPPQPKIKLAEPRKMQRQKRAKEAEQIVKDAEDEKKQPIETRLENAARDIAKTLGGDEVKTESELLNSLLQFKPDREPKNIEDVLKGMKTESKPSPPPKTRSQYVRESLSDVGRRKVGGFISNKAAPWKSEGSYSLFGEQPLGIFPKNFPNNAKKGVTLNTWNKLVDREVKFSVTHTPKNYFEEMIQWTEQGKLWQFPIDNEQGLEKEKEIHFSDHIMLYDHLEPWCPPRGPIRHFMELVCVGLSKNPYYTVEEKREHILFYRDYFKQKNDLLKETGCGEIRDTPRIGEPNEDKASEKNVEP